MIEPAPTKLRVKAPASSAIEALIFIRLEAFLEVRCENGNDRFLLGQTLNSGFYPNLRLEAVSRTDACKDFRFRFVAQGNPPEFVVYQNYVSDFTFSGRILKNLDHQPFPRGNDPQLLRGLVWFSPKGVRQNDPRKKVR